MWSQESEWLWWSRTRAMVVLVGTVRWARCPSLLLLRAQAVLACFRLLCARLLAPASEQLSLAFPLAF